MERFDICMWFIGLGWVGIQLLEVWAASLVESSTDLFCTCWPNATAAGAENLAKVADFDNVEGLVAATAVHGVSLEILSSEESCALTPPRGHLHRPLREHVGRHVGVGALKGASLVDWGACPCCDELEVDGPRARQTAQSRALIGKSVAAIGQSLSLYFSGHYHCTPYSFQQTDFYF